MTSTIDPEVEIEIEKDSAEIASEEGFTGTFAGFLDWLKDALNYGGIVVGDEAPNDYGRPVVQVKTVTGGFSTNEHLLGRVSASWLFRSSWVSSHRGGLEVFEFAEWLRDDAERVWLEPETEVFETIHRVRRVRVYDEQGDFVELNYESAAQLLFHEPERDINEPAGLLTIRPFNDGSRW